MSDLIRKSTSSLLQLSAGLVQCTGWLALICLPRTEKIFEIKLDKLLAGFDIPGYGSNGDCQENPGFARRADIDRKPILR